MQLLSLLINNQYAQLQTFAANLDPIILSCSVSIVHSLCSQAISTILQWLSPHPTYLYKVLNRQFYVFHVAL